MAEKYHISPTTGNPNRCYANTKPCPLGGADDHYPSKDAARKGFEKKQASPLGGLKKAKKASAPAAPAKAVKAAPPKTDAFEDDDLAEEPSLDSLDDSGFDAASVEAWEKEMLEEEKNEWEDDEDDVWDSSSMNPDEYEERTGRYTYSWDR